MPLLRSRVGKIFFPKSTRFERERLIRHLFLWFVTVLGIIGMVAFMIWALYQKGFK
jgi:hypothetical protein